MPSDSVKMVAYRNKATGIIVSFEQGSRGDRRCKADRKRYESLSKQPEPVKTEKPVLKTFEKKGKEPGDLPVL